MVKDSGVITRLEQVLGKEQVLTREDSKAYYTKGFRVGGGNALAVAIPQTLMQLWQVLQACVA